MSVTINLLKQRLGANDHQFDYLMGCVVEGLSQHWRTKSKFPSPISDHLAAMVERVWHLRAEGLNLRDATDQVRGEMDRSGEVLLMAHPRSGKGPQLNGEHEAHMERLRDKDHHIAFLEAELQARDEQISQVLDKLG